MTLLGVLKSHTRSNVEPPLLSVTAILRSRTIPAGYLLLQQYCKRLFEQERKVGRQRRSAMSRCGWNRCDNDAATAVYRETTEEERQLSMKSYRHGVTWEQI